MEMNKFTEEQIAKAKACKDEAELLELAKAEGVELSDEDLDSISGGWGSSSDDDKNAFRKQNCPKCGSSNVTGYQEGSNPHIEWHCNSCNHEWG